VVTRPRWRGRRWKESKGRGCSLGGETNSSVHGSPSRETPGSPFVKAVDGQRNFNVLNNVVTAGSSEESRRNVKLFVFDLLTSVHSQTIKLPPKVKVILSPPHPPEV
jgi:hypothetical protein